MYNDVTHSKMTSLLVGYCTSPSLQYWMLEPSEPASVQHQLVLGLCDLPCSRSIKDRPHASAQTQEASWQHAQLRPSDPSSCCDVPAGGSSAAAGHRQRRRASNPETGEQGDLEVVAWLHTFQAAHVLSKRMTPRNCSLKHPFDHLLIDFQSPTAPTSLRAAHPTCCAGAAEGGCNGSSDHADAPRRRDALLVTFQHRSRRRQHGRWHAADSVHGRGQHLGGGSELPERHQLIRSAAVGHRHRRPAGGVRDDGRRRCRSHRCPRCHAGGCAAGGPPHLRLPARPGPLPCT